MQVHKLGDGEAEYVIVGSLHGDEPCGKRAIERFLDSDYEVEAPVKFIIANEEALEQNQRFLDTDLNRSFPGDPESESHEERLAAEIMKEVKGKKVLDLHTTQSYPGPFATFSNLNDTTLSLIRSAGVGYAVLFPSDSGALNEKVDGIVVETGYQQTEQAVENGYSIIVNFLAAEGVINAEYKLSEPEIFEYYETVEGDWEFVAENFKQIEKGEVYARRDGEELRAEESFYPILMSTSGYEGKLGFKAKKIRPSEI